jgi:hypothetical protein
MSVTLGTSADAPLDLPPSLPGAYLVQIVRRTLTSPRSSTPAKGDVPLVQTACRWACASARAVAKLSLQDVDRSANASARARFPVPARLLRASSDLSAATKRAPAKVRG